MNWHTKSQGPKKKVSIFLGGGSTLAPHTPLVIRVVFLHIWRFVQSFFPQLYVYKKPKILSVSWMHNHQSFVKSLSIVFVTDKIVTKEFS